MKKAIVVCGATASGKTALAVELALRYGGEVISADSMQIYNDMQIASAMPTSEEKKGVPHHLMGFLPSDKRFSVAEYVKLAKEKTDDIISRGKMPIICGGTGLYISALTENIKFDDSEADYEFREEMRRKAENEGGAALLEMLRAVDPITAGSLHENNVSRIIRALEVYKTTGHTIAQAKIDSRREKSEYEFIILGLDYANRQKLYERINKRVDNMMRQGLLEEARRCFLDTNRPTAAQAIGCKEFYPYFRGEKTLDECVEELKLRTRQYAKRQITWFKRDKRIYHIIIEDGEKLNVTADKACAVINSS